MGGEQDMDKTYKLHIGLLIAVLLAFLILPSVSAVELGKITYEDLPDRDMRFDNIPTYENIGDFGKYIIKDSIIGIPFLQLDTIKEIELKSNTPICSNDCEAKSIIILSKETTLVDNVRFFRIYEDGSRELSSIRDYKFYVRTNEKLTDVNDYKWQCVNTNELYKNGTVIQDCGIAVVGTHKEYADEWMPYDYQVMPIGTYEIKLVGNKKPEWAYDWQIETSGVWTTEWSVWGSSLSYQENSHSVTFTGTHSAQDTVKGLAITVYQNYTLYNITREASSTCTNFSLSTNADGNTGIISTAGSWSGNVFTLTTPQNLTNATKYYFLMRKGACDHRYTASQTYPISGQGSASTWQITGQSNDGVDYGDGQAIFNFVGFGTSTETTGSSVTINSPVNYYNTSSAITFNCSATVSGGATLTNISLWTNSTGTFARNTTNVLTGASNSTTFTKTFSDGSYLWTCQGCDTDGACGFASSNRTVTIDTIAPVVTITAPTSSKIVYNPNENITINYSVSNGGTPLNKCWFNSSYNATATYFTNCQTNGSVLFPPTNPATFTIYVYANDTVNNVGYSNVTITKDTTKPTFVLNSLNNVSTITLPVNATMNVTTADVNLANCSYITNDNSTRVIYTCNTIINILFQTGGSKTITVYGNDTFGNENSTTYPFNIYDFSITQSGETTAGEGSSQTFTLLINSTSFAIGDASANLWYDGSNKGYTTKTAIGSNAYYFTSVFTIPTGTGNSTGKAINWYWNYNATQLTTRNTSTQTQTVYNVSITDCASVGGRVILNMSLKDEELNTLVNITTPNTATVEIDMYVTSLINSSQVWQFYKKWESNNSVAVCVPNGLLNSTSYKIDFTIGYDATGKVREFYYIDNGTLDNTDYFNSYTDNTIDLMDLASADSTTFLFSFTDADGLEIDDALVHTFRKYIGEGLFREVERSKQDNNGQTHVHLVEEDVIYYFMVTQYGNIIFTSDQYNAKCLSTPCEITLSASATDTDWSIIDNEGGKYAVTSDKSTRIVTLDFDLDASSLVNMSLYKYNGANATFINGSSLTAMAGSIPLHVPIVYGNDTFFAVIYNNNTFVKSAWIDLTESGKDYFGTTGAILSGLVVLSMMLMAVSEGVGFIIFTVLALIVVTAMKLVNLNALAFISIICAGGIIMWKLVNRRNKPN
jgi:hypothetical protein